MKHLNLTNRIRKERRIRIFTTPGISFLRRISYGRKKYDLCGSISQRNVHRSLHKIEKSSSSDIEMQIKTGLCSFNNTKTIAYLNDSITKSKFVK